MSPKTDPPQPEEVVEAIAGVLAADDAGPDPWWLAGVEDSLEE